MRERDVQRSCGLRTSSLIYSPFAPCGPALAPGPSHPPLSAYTMAPMIYLEDPKKLLKNSPHSCPWPHPFLSEYSTLPSVPPKLPSKATARAGDLRTSAAMCSPQGWFSKQCYTENSSDEASCSATPSSAPLSVTAPGSH